MLILQKHWKLNFEQGKLGTCPNWGLLLGTSKFGMKSSTMTPDWFATGMVYWCSTLLVPYLVEWTSSYNYQVVCRINQQNPINKPGNRFRHVACWSQSAKFWACRRKRMASKCLWIHFNSAFAFLWVSTFSVSCHVVFDNDFWRAVAIRFT